MPETYSGSVTLSRLIFLGIFAGTLALYFSELLIALKRPLSEVPTLVTAATIVMLMPVAIRAYSIAVAPESFRRKSDMSFEIRRTANSRRWHAQRIGLRRAKT